ncbi:MAG: DUF896 domain-containing protein [Firmicutes bacterium]|nr:DUF896 domain-containing protein [Bacillota bacterium]
MDSELIKRINELARLKKEKGLTPQQQLEQDRLRKLYLAGIRAQVQAQLDGISIKEPDGTVHPLTPASKQGGTSKPFS